eukprot:CAMPEP_0183721010 /NCGR_PEP_ID=MMETSP0737-20130205/13457_1 /TAXON_ID=385413 /ORGANISM="Thalassiosira miniscula, Strain CCMP1093" /LENGTH=407 /DNA_ID=CAMNT_0025950973 /DNA_START=5 /DNA_END=1228 /DNA_ORIENTATION=+
MASTHWNILSSWSKAGVGTSIVMELKKPPSSPSSSSPVDVRQNQPSAKKASPRISFDIGATRCFDDAIPAKYVFLSHGHVDHAGAMFSHARAHSVSSGGTAATYFVPAQLMPQIEKCRDAMSLLDASNTHTDEEGGRKTSLISMNLVPVYPGDEVPLKGIHYGSKSKTSFFMRAFEVDHAGHPALGYAIGSRTSTGLKAEYKNLDAASIRDLVKSGVSIKADPIEQIEVAYTGDTCARGLFRQSTGEGQEESMIKEEMGPEQKPLRDVRQIFQAELLLCELTFLDSSEKDSQSKAMRRGHLHINDLERIFSSRNQFWKENIDNEETETTPTTCQYPKNIVFYHLSAKYQPARRALDLIAEGLPSQLRDRCHVAISSMLSQEERSREHPVARLIQPNGCISIGEYTTH